MNVWSTGMTSTMGLAATWSREDARKNGTVIARDAKALEKLTREVNEAIMLGWEPIGGLTTVGGQRFFQAMIKRR